MTKHIDNEISSQNEESSQGEFHKEITDSLNTIWQELPLALRETNQMLPDILKTSKQAGRYMPIVFFGFIKDIVEYHHEQKMTQLAKKSYKMRKRLTRLQKERLEFDKFALSRGEIPDHIFQQVQECQELEERKASL